MTTVANPLHVQFGNSAARVWCNDSTLRRSLACYFRHCLAEGASTVITYHIDEVDRIWQLRRDNLLLYVEPSALRILERFLHDVTRMFIKHARLRLLLHAAGIARGNNGIILCGRSGSGKSTLSAWLVANGFDFLTDELVALHFDCPEMSGFTRPLILKQGSSFIWQRWLSAETQERLNHFSDGTLWLDPEELRPGCVQSTASPRLILFPRHVAGNSLNVKSLSAAEALFHLMGHAVNIGNLFESGFAAITRLARQTRAYSVTYGDVTQAGGWLTQVHQSLCLLLQPQL